MINSTPQQTPVEDTLSVKFSLRNKLLLLLLGITIAVFIAVAYLSITSIQTVGQAAQQISGDALRRQAQEFLIEVAVDNARENDLILSKIQTDAQNTAQYAASVFSNPQAFATGVNWFADEKMFVGPDGQYINGPDDTSSVFVPNTVVIDENVKNTLELGAYLDPVFVPVYENDENSVAIYLIGKPDVTRLYPNIELGQIVPADFEATKDIFFTSGAPENNPTGQTVWTSIYDDPAGQGLLVSTVSPIYLDNGEFFGIIGIDVSLDNLAANIEGQSGISDAYSFLIDGEGRAIALPAQGYEDFFGRPPQAGDVGPDLGLALPAFSDVLAEMQSGAAGFATIQTDEGEELFISYAPLTNTGWSLGTVARSENVLGAVADLQQSLADATTSLIINRLIPVGGAILVVVLIIGLWLTNRLVNPLRQLAAAARQIGNRQWDTPLPATGNDEVGLLSRTLKIMINQLHDLFDTLEDQVLSRTRRLESAAALGERLTAILNFDPLLVELVNRVKEDFDYYHVHIYIIDGQRQNLVMSAGVGEAGAQMKAQGHQIAINAPTSLVARAARTGTIVRVDNVREAPDWLPNPLLPDTYSEMAVPIIVENQVMGVLDVQQDEIAGLDEGDAGLLRSVATQVAVAIRNARLFEAVETALAEAQAAQEQYLQQSWDRTKLSAKSQQYVYIDPQTGESVETKQTIPSKIKQQAGQTSRPTVINGQGDDQTTVVAPVSLRGKAIGVLQLQSGKNGHQWSEQDLAMVETVINQLAQTAETLRLFEETRQRAGQEQAVREITDKLRVSTDMEQLLKTAAEVLGQRFSASHVKLRLGGSVSQNDTNGQQ